MKCTTTKYTQCFVFEFVHYFRIRHVCG